jgi:hypothetical protein
MGAGASSCAVSLLQGSQIELEAVPNSGSEFRGWELDASSCGAAPSCTLTVSGGLTIAARFEVAAPAGPSASKSTITAAPLTVSPGETSDAVVTPKDEQGTPLPCVHVALFPTGAAVAIEPSSAVTDQSGKAKFSITPKAAGSVTIAASAGNVIIAQQLNLSVVTGQHNNAPPSASDDSFEAANNQTSTFAVPGVLANDSDPEGSRLTVELVTGAQSGTVNLSADGSFTYTPYPQYSGPDSFTYRASDGEKSSNVATVRLTVRGGQTVGAPVASDDAFDAAQGMNQTSTFAAPGVLANDIGSGGSPLQAHLVSGPQYGTVELHTDGSFSYTPFPLYAGADSFTYQVSTGTTSSNTATVRLSVIGTQGVPMALCNDGTLSFSEHHQGTCSHHGGVSVWYR